MFITILTNKSVDLQKIRTRNNFRVFLFINLFQLLRNLTHKNNAPNFGYIPAYLDSNYPKNFSFKPLNGEQLRQAAQEAFCNMSDEDKKKNILARANYPR